MVTPAALVLRRSNRTICRTTLSKGFRAAPKIGIRLMFLSNRGLEPHWLLGCWGNKHQRIKIATKSYAYLSYWRLGYRARSASHPGGVYMDRLRGSGPQHPRDPAASEPSQDSGKWQEYDEEKGGPALRMGLSARPTISRMPPICPAAALPKRAFNRAAPRGVARSASRCQQLWCGDFDVAHVLFVAVRRPHTEQEGFRHARNVAAE